MDDFGRALDAICPFDFRAAAENLLAGSHNLWAQIFEYDEFQTWSEGQSWQLRCVGSPRCGKVRGRLDDYERSEIDTLQTTFMATAGKHLEQESEGDVAVIRLFFGLIDVAAHDGAADPKVSGIEFILRVILRQLLEGLCSSQQVSGNSKECLQALTHDSNDLLQLDAALLKKHIEATCRLFPRVYVLVDDIHRVCHVSETDLTRALADVGIESVMFVGLPHESFFPKDGLECDHCGEGQTVPLWADCEECKLVFCSSCHEEGHSCHDEVELPSFVEINIEPTTDSVLQYIDLRLEELHEDPALQQSAAVDIGKESELCFGLARATIDNFEEYEALEDVGEVSDRLPPYHVRFFNMALWQVQNQAMRADQSLGMLSLALVALAGNDQMSFRQLKSALSLLDPNSQRTGLPLSRKRISNATHGWIFSNPNDDADDLDDTLAFFVSPARTFIHERPGFYDRKLDDGKPILHHGQDFAMLCLNALVDSHELIYDIGGDPRAIHTELRERAPFLEYALKQWPRHFREYSTRKTLHVARTYLEAYYQQNAQMQCLLFALSGNRHQAISSNLLVATTFHLTPLVKWYLTNGSDPNEIDVVTGRTPIMVACEAGHDEIVHLLLKAKADLSLSCNDGHTALWYAVEGGHRHIVRCILRSGEESLLNTRDGAGKTPFTRAIELWHRVPRGEFDDLEHNRQDIVKAMMKIPKLNIASADGDGKTALHLACDLLHVPSLDVMLHTEVGKMLINHHEFSEFGRTPLMLAVTTPVSSSPKHRLEVFELLLQHGASVRLSDAKGRTVLHHAVTLVDDDHPDLIRVIIEHNADPDAQDGLGRTPLHTAYAVGNAGAIELLEASGASRTITDWQGRTASQLGEATRQAQAHDEEFLAKFPSSEDAIPASVDPLNQSILHRLVLVSEEVEPINALLSSAVIDVNAQNVFLQTALHLAIIRYDTTDDRTMVRGIISSLLAKEGMDLEIRDGNLERPIDVALRLNVQPSLVFELLANGAKLHRRPEDIDRIFATALRSKKWASADVINELIKAGGDVFKSVKSRSGLSEEVLGVIEAEEESVWKCLNRK